MDLAFVLLQLGGGVRSSIPSLVMSASPFSKAVLALLLGMSVWSWAIIWDRLKAYRRVLREDQAFLTAFRSLPDPQDAKRTAELHPGSLLGRVALAGQKALEQLPASSTPTAARWELAQRAMDRAA